MSSSEQVVAHRTAIAKEVQRELHDASTDQPVDVYLADVVKRARSGQLDEALVYRKNLRKDTEEYTATTLPHVAAARSRRRRQDA